MNKLRTISILTLIFLMAIIVGFIFHEIVANFRVEAFCQLKEGGDCYDENWENFPWWQSAIVGMVMAVFSMAAAALFKSNNGVSYLTIVYGWGVFIAAPFAYFAQSVLAYIATVAAGALALWIAKRLTKPGSLLRAFGPSRDSLPCARFAQVAALPFLRKTCTR